MKSNLNLILFALLLALLFMPRMSPMCGKCGGS
jgi:hypothetical protein